MKSNHIVQPNDIYFNPGIKAGQNPELISRQIEALRVVMRRMKSNKSATLDALIQQKLKELQ